MLILTIVGFVISRIIAWHSTEKVSSVQGTDRMQTNRGETNEPRACIDRSENPGDQRLQRENRRYGHGVRVRRSSGQPGASRQGCDAISRVGRIRLDCRSPGEEASKGIANSTVYAEIAAGVVGTDDHTRGRCHGFESADSSPGLLSLRTFYAIRSGSTRGRCPPRADFQRTKMRRLTIGISNFPLQRRKETP